MLDSAAAAVVIVVVQSLRRVQLFVTPWTAAHQAPLSSVISQSLLKFMSIESMMLSNHLILCHPLLLLPSIFPRIRIFSNELTLHTRGAKVLELLVPAVQQSESAICIHIPLFFGFPSHLGHHRALRKDPCAIQKALIGYLFYTRCQ